MNLSNFYKKSKKLRHEVVENFEKLKKQTTSSQKFKQYFLSLYTIQFKHNVS